MNTSNTLILTDSPFILFLTQDKIIKSDLVSAVAYKLSPNLLYRFFFFPYCNSSGLLKHKSPPLLLKLSSNSLEHHSILQNLPPSPLPDSQLLAWWIKNYSLETCQNTIFFSGRHAFSDTSFKEDNCLCSIITHFPITKSIIFIYLFIYLISKLNNIPVNFVYQCISAIR